MYLKIHCAAFDYIEIFITMHICKLIKNGLKPMLLGAMEQTLPNVLFIYDDYMIASTVCCVLL